MSDPLTLSALAARLLPVARAALKAVSRPNAERRAGRTPASSNLMEKNLDQTLGRLRGGKIEDSWWRKVLDRIAQEYIAPDFLTKPALQEWLAEEQVADGLKALARAKIMGRDGRDPEVRELLANSYSTRTGEAGRFAQGPIDVVVGILVAGYIASISSDDRPMAGMIQELSGHLDERFDQLEGARRSALADAITQKTHTDHAEQELTRIRRLRALDPGRSLRKSQELLERISDGDLVAANDATKTEVRYWTARLCAADAETLDLARQIRAELCQIDPEKDLSIVDALIAEGDGDIDGALRLLRDRDDPDSRTAFFGVLARSRGTGDALAWQADQAVSDDGTFFTAVGWRNWAVCMAKVGQWKEAALRLRSFESHWQEMPALAFVEGIINAAMLLPDEVRELVFENVPSYEGITPNFFSEAENHHSRASTCLEFAEKSVTDIADENLARLIFEWRLWLRLMDPADGKANAAHQEIRQRMEDGAQAVKVIPFAYAFNISCNREPLGQYLRLRKQLGGLDDHELLAECLLAEQDMTPRDLVTYLEQCKARLSELVPPAFVITKHVDALVRDGQTEKARALVKEQAAHLDEAISNRLIAMIDAGEGKDPRKRLETQYDQTRSLVDLRNLVSHLKTVGDLVALRPLTRELFHRAPTVGNAHDVVSCLSDPSFFDHDAIIGFLDANPAVLEQSDDLKRAKAWALFHAGRFQESKQINDVLLSKRENRYDLHLDVNIAVSSGDWERLAVIVDREWPRRDSHDPETLMTLAQRAGQGTQNADRALGLAKLAAEKAEDDPKVLAAVWFLYIRLGRDGDVNPDWFVRASELSSADEGPLWSTNLQGVVTDWLPKRREYQREVNQKLLNGEIPINLAASRFNVPLARLLLSVSDQNVNEVDGRRRTILPIVAGGRDPVELQEDWTIGLDVTSIMVLGHLDLLETAVNTFHHVKLPPEVMELLFRERIEVRFHQPSLIREARRVQELQGREQLRVADHLPASPKAVTDEVGVELAALLEMARQDNGKVVCVLPIYRAGSLMEEHADTREFDDLILSTVDICALLHDVGKIDNATHRYASACLKGDLQTEQSNLPPLILNAPIYLDRAALSYLQGAKLLRPMATAGLDIRIHPDVMGEMNALINESDVGDDLATKIEGIRNVLRSAVESGTASFLPRSDRGEDNQRHDVGIQAIVSLLAGKAVCDVLCIDDRFVNRNFTATGPTERSLPVVCVLDVLRHLVAQGRISVADHWTARHRLRQGGFVIIPLESDELVHWLEAAKFNDGQLTESAELRTLRQAMAYIDSLELTLPAEALALTTNAMTTCWQVIVDLWKDADLTKERAAGLSDWVWRSLTAMAVSHRRYLPANSHADWLKKTMSLRVCAALLPMVVQSPDRRAHYAYWIERSVLQRLRPANADMIEMALSRLCEYTSALEDYWELYGNLFLEQLPEWARRKVRTGNSEFASRYGLETRRMLRIGPDVRLIQSELVAAAREVFATKGGKSVQDISGNDVSVGFDLEGRNIVVQWSDAGAVSHQVQIPDLALLSPDREARLTALRNVIDRLGPTATDFRYLLEEIESRELNHQELSAIFDETSNGVAALQANLMDKIQGGLGFAVTDVIPSSTSYFERFAGPSAITWEPEAYFHEVLVPYRKSLLDRHLPAGLDICCLGALRDDLMPGQWVESMDDDAVWEALASCHATGNPFSLLGALDVALYRQGDPRFREFAAEAVASLSNENFGKHDGPDLYRLLFVLAEWVANRINLLENGSNCPRHWKRMCAWMQAGLTARALMASASSIDIDNLQEWTRENMFPAGALAVLVDARKEPMLFTSRMAPWALRSEILGRLYILKLRHENEGHQVPRSEEIDRALAPSRNPEQTLVLGLPGPLEGHKRPTEFLPQDLGGGLEDAWTGSSKLFALQQLAVFSQRFALAELELEHAREAVKTITVNVDSADRQENLKCLELASVVAAASRDTTLADGIAGAVIGIVPRISEAEEIASVLQITLQAAAAYEAHDAWFKWLEERFTNIAVSLPSPPNDSLRMFLGHLGALDSVLPIESWFHIRARSIALAGAG